MYKLLLTILTALVLYLVFSFAQVWWNGLQYEIEQSHLADEHLIAESQRKQLEQVLEQAEEEYQTVPDRPIDPNAFPTNEERNRIIGIMLEVAKDEGFTQTGLLLDYARCESDFRQYVRGDDDKSRGMFQIYSDAHPEVSDERAFDIEFSTRWAIKVIQQGNQEKEWRLCTLKLKNKL